MAKNAHFNILRIWGGGIVNKESFFDICYELGILVWQEFPLACNNYTDDARNTAYTEFGVPGVSNLDVLKRFIPETELFPPKKNTTWELHHVYSVWGAERWLEMPVLEKYFGTVESLEALVAYSQLLHCEGLKFIYEEARRQKPF